MQSTAVRVQVMLNGTLVKEWQPVELRYDVYSRLVQRLDPLTPKHLVVKEHRLVVNLVDQRKVGAAVCMVERVVSIARARKSGHDEPQLNNSERQLTRA